MDPKTRLASDKRGYVDPASPSMTKMRRLSRAAEEVAKRAGEMGIDPEHLLDFEAARRRPLKRRMGMFFRTYKPVLDDAPYRAFDSTAEYRRWCNENLPMWLGYWSRHDDGTD